MSKYDELKKYFLEKKDVVDWVELPEKFSTIISDACADGVIESCGECEVYYYCPTKRAPDARKSGRKSRSKNSKGSAKPARG